MSHQATIALPRGYWLDGVCYREARLRPLTGEDENFVVEEGGSLSTARWTTALLAHCVTYLWPSGQVTSETIRSLSVGDREALLLHLRRLAVGDRLQCVLTCPAQDCGEKMDLDLSVSDLLLPPYSDPQEWHETTIIENGSSYRVQFRLPNGGDQEAAVDLARDDPQAAAEAILRRCISSVAAKDNGKDSILDWQEWPPAVARDLPAIMAEHDPQAELVLNLTCPVCGHAFSTIFDTATYFLAELAGRATNLYREVHLLAYYYHWGEAEIMGMTARKRHVYLDLLADAIGAGRS